MDEKTVRIALQIPEDMLRFLERLARREGFEARKTGRAIRWCIREEMKRQYERDDQKHFREYVAKEPSPPPEIYENRKSAAESFPDDLTEEDLHG